MKKIAALVSLLVILATAGSLWAEPVDPPKKDESLKISGVFFAEYAQALNGNQDGHFAVNRMYLTMKKNLPGFFSFRVTLDALALKDGSGDTAEGYQALLKYAYLQAAPTLGIVELKMQGGIIGTPVVGMVNKLTGIRWIGNTYLSSSKAVLTDDTGASLGIDTSADLGVSLNMSFDKKVSLTGAFTNGEGYKDVDSAGYSNGKSYYATLSVNPFRDLFINGYFRYLQRNDTDGNLMYYGGGVALKGNMWRLGVNCVGVTLEKATTETGFLAEAWASGNLDSLIGFPLLLFYRMGYGHGLDGADTGQYGGALGYKFNKNVQCALHYEATDYESAATDHRLYGKVEVKI